MCSASLKFSLMHILHLLLLLLSCSHLAKELHQSVQASQYCEFPAIFNFGDSNSDTGGWSAALTPIKPPCGMTFFGMPAGRLSDGRLIIDFIAESFGLCFLSAYLDSVGTNFSQGANFATSGSEILPPFTREFSPFTLDVQLSQFMQFKYRSQLAIKKGGMFKRLMPKERYFSQALYTFDIGQNDLTAKAFLHKSGDEFIPDALKLFSKTIKDIYNNGGRYFWIHNTGPLGCLPFTLFNLDAMEEKYDLDSAGCAIPYNELAQHFNKMLNETIVKLRRDLPLAALTYVDVYSVKYLLISQAANDYGFEHPRRACCGYGGGEYNLQVECGETSKVNDTERLVGKSCEDPSKSISWDGCHYTDAANKWVFEQIVNGKFSDPPNSLRMACGKKAN